MKTIQVIFDQDDWSKSMLTATGVMKDGKVLSSSLTTMRVDELPKKYGSTMGKIFERFLTIDPGGKMATSAKAMLKEEPASDEEAPAVSVELTIVWLYPDQTTELEVFRLDDSASVALMEYVLNAKSYAKRLR